MGALAGQAPGAGGVVSWLTEAQLHVARLQDALEVWGARDPSRHHPRVRRAGEDACRACDDLVAVFCRLREDVTAECGAYDQAVRRGG